MPKRSIPIAIAVFLTLTFSSCTCIYFNTFHNIRENFNGAEKTRKKEGRDAARGAEVKQYTDAIAKASRVLERHPTSSWVDDALYIIGASYYYLGEFDKADRKFKELFANYPESKFIPQTRVLMAKTKLQLKEEAEAVVIFEEILEREKDRSMRANAARSLGQYYFETKDYEKANPYFLALIDSLGEESDKLRALIYVGDGYFDMYAFAKAKDSYRKALDHTPDTLQTYHLTFRLAECDYYLNNISAGLEKLGEMADNERYYDSLAPIRLKMAEGYEWEGDFNAAIDAFEQVIVENPKKNPAAIAYYQLGLIYQYDFEDLEKARGYYQKSREEVPGSPVAQDATRRASKLALLEQYTRSGETAAADTAAEISPDKLDQFAKNQFLLGELFYFDLEKPDSAVHAYKLLLDRYPTSVYAPRALMSMSYIYRADYRDSASADSLLRLVPERYSRYDESREVIGMLGLAGTIADSGYAAITFGRAENFLEEFRALDSSMYYARLAVESMPPTDTGEGEGPQPSEDTGSGDSLKTEDLYLTPAGPAPTDSARTADSVRRPDSLQAIDSIGIDDSIRVADSIHAMELMRMADSLRALKASAAPPPAGPPATAPIDSMVRLDSFMKRGSSPRPDSTDSQSLVRPDTLMVGPPQPQPDTLIAINSVSTAMFGPPLDSLAMKIPDSSTTDTMPATYGPPFEPEIMGPPMPAARPRTRPETGAATAKAVDSLAQQQAVHIDYWGETFKSAKAKYNQRQLQLLDSAHYYYQYVVDSFPYSMYGVQARYVMLWMYDRYLSPGDSSLMAMYRTFVDSFPQSEYAQAIADEYGIRAVGVPQRPKPGQGQQQEETPADTAQFARENQPDTGNMAQGMDTTSQESKFITRDGKQLEPAKKYFMREAVTFDYPIDALAYNIEDKLYFQIRIDFSGKVVEAVLLNPTRSDKLNELILETVKQTEFDEGRIPAELYDSWFYYTYDVKIPSRLRQ